MDDMRKIGYASARNHRNAKDDDYRKNGEGYPDPTAYEAIRRVDGDLEHFRKTVGAIRRICELAGYDLEEHVVLRDIRTGKVWR